MFSGLRGSRILKILWKNNVSETQRLQNIDNPKENAVFRDSEQLKNNENRKEKQLRGFNSSKFFRETIVCKLRTRTQTHRRTHHRPTFPQGGGGGVPRPQRHHRPTAHRGGGGPSPWGGEGVRATRAHIFHFKKVLYLPFGSSHC